MTPLKLAAIIALISGPTGAETFSERWPRATAAESTSAVVPPVILVQDEDKPPASRRRRQAGDICSRHHRHKVTTRGGKSWRCRK